MKNVNFLSNKFKKIEDEELKEKKKREQNLNLKRKLLKDEFTCIDELEKHTQKQQELIFQLKGSTEVEFKNELDKQIEYKKAQQKQLEQLKKQFETLKNEQQQKGSEFEQNFSSQQQNQFATKSNYSAKQFSTIFSKSYYRSSAFQFLSHSKINNQQDIIEHLEKLKQDIETTESNIINEDERTLSIKNQVEQLFKTKQKIKQELGELESLNEAADKRFDNLQRIQFLAQEKQKTTFKQLSKIKSELQEQDTIRQGILSKQEEQREKEHQGRKENEEVTGNIMIKIDELQKQYDQTKQELQTILIQERKIIKKRMQSKYILKYIDFFESFREIFCGQEVDEERIKRLYDAQDAYSLNEIEHIDEIIKEKNTEVDARSNLSVNSSNNTPRGHSDSQTYHQRSASSPLRQTNRDSIKEVEQKTEENQIQSDEEITQMALNIFFQQQKVERTELINKINNFLDLYPTGLDVCIENVFRLFNEMRYQQETDNEKYEQFLKAKTQKTQDLLILENKFNELKKNNPYVEVMRQNSIEEEKIENIQEAFDAGYAKINYPKYPLISGNKDGEELANKLSHYTTVNIMKLSDMTDFQPIIEEIKYNKNFFFNFFMNYGDSIIRICKIIKTIFKKILQNIPSLQMNKRCSETIKYINSIWQDNENNKEIIESNFNLPDQIDVKQNTTESNKSQNTNLLNLPLIQFGHTNSMMSQMSALTPQLKSPVPLGHQQFSFQVNNRHRSRISIDTAGMEQMEQIQEQFNRKQKKRRIIVEKFSIEEINNLFSSIFGDGFEKQAKEFFQEIKDDRLVWFFCNLDVIQEYLITKYNQNNNDPNLAVEDAIMNFIQVEEYASQEYNHRLNDLYNHFIGLMDQIKLENNEILEDLNSRNINYRPHRIFKSNELQNNPKITQAIENAIKRKNEYLFSISDNTVGKEDQFGNNANNQTGTLHHHSSLSGSLMNTRNNSSDQKAMGIGSQAQNNSRLQQIIEYIQNVPSTRQREAAKKKYISTPSLHYSVSSKIQSGINSGSNFGNGSTQNPSSNPRGSFSISKDFVPIVQFQQNSIIQFQQNPQQQQNQSQSNQNQNQNQILSQTQQLGSPTNQQQQGGNGQNNQNTQSAIGVDQQQQRLAAISGGILKNKIQPRKTQDYKSLQDIYEDNFIDEEAQKQKEREKQEYLEYLQKEKELNQKLLQIEKEKPNTHVKIIKNLGQRLTFTTDSQNSRNKSLRQFSQNQKILSKIDRLDRNYDPSETANNVFNGILQEKKNIYKSMVQQEQDERLGSENEKNTFKQISVFNEDDKPEYSIQKQGSLRKSQSDYLIIKTTNANEQRKKSITQTIKQQDIEDIILNDNQQNSDKVSSNPQSQKQRQRDKTKSQDKNQSSVKSWKSGVSTSIYSKRPDTQQNSSSQKIQNQFYLSQNQKFFQKYQNMSNDKMPNISENRSLDKRIPHSSKSSNNNSMKNLKYQLGGNQNINYQKSKANNKSEQFFNKIHLQGDSKINNEFKLGDFDRSSFYDFPFFSHPLSVANSSHNIPMYPFLQPPTLNLYTPTGLLTNFGKNENINIQNTQSYY